MRDNELLICKDWRFCNVQNGDKKPYPNNWQNNPLTLQQIESSNIGLQLGQHSNGTCAIDFDGIEAIDYWTDIFPQYPIDQLNTIMWTSGKEYRLQAAFIVPEEYWSVLKRKVVSKLEFRWGGQSVMPPSKLNDGRQYTWINPPSNTMLQPLPDDVLAYWLTLIYEDMTKYDNVVPQQYQTTTVDEEFVNILLEKIQHKVGNLRGDYDLWRTIAWATCSCIGISSAKMLLQYYWPEKTKKEMPTLMSWKPRANSPKIGTLIKLSGITLLERQLMELENKLRSLK